MYLYVKLLGISIAQNFYVQPVVLSLAEGMLYFFKVLPNLNTVSLDLSWSRFVKKWNFVTFLTRDLLSIPLV